MPGPDNAPSAESSEGALVSDDISKIDSVSGDIVGTTVVAVVMAGTFGPLVTAFCTELGKRLGGNVADWASRVRLIHKKKDSNKAVLLVHTGPTTTVMEINEDLPDEARLALLDLDVESDAIRGQRLRWNVQVGAWLPKDKAEQPPAKLLRQQPKRQSRGKRSGRH